MQIRLVLTALTCLTILMVGCSEPAPEPTATDSPTTEATAVLPVETPSVAESAAATMPVTDTQEIAEATPVSQTEQPVAEQPIAVEPLSETDSEAAAPGPGAATIANLEEGRITFKSPSLHGSPTASGEPFDKDAMTAAHKVLPFGTVVTVTNLFNGKQTTVTVNDRLPSHVSAIFDLSPAAAEAIDMIDAGIVDGRIEW